MRYCLIGAVMLVSHSVAAQAPLQSVCQSKEETRIVKVQYQADGEVPCQVVYEKFGQQHMLWAAQNQQGYCEEKAQAFVEKLRGLGFACSELAAENSAVSSETEVSPAS